MEILIIGQLLNLVTNLTKVKIRRLEKLHKYLITNAYDIVFNRTCINERLLPNFAYIYIFSSGNDEVSWLPSPFSQALINQTEKPRRWGRVSEREIGGAPVVLPYVGHQMLNFTLI